MSALIVLVMWVASVGMPAVAAEDTQVPQLAEAPLQAPPSPQAAAARVKSLTSRLRCPVCQGLSISASPSDSARAMSGVITELVGKGYTEAQITDYFVDRYGEWVVLEPEAAGWHWVLFLAPGVVFIFGVVAMQGALRRRSVSSSPVPKADDELAAYRERVLAELEGGRS